MLACMTGKSARYVCLPARARGPRVSSGQRAISFAFALARVRAPGRWWRAWERDGWTVLIRRDWRTISFRRLARRRGWRWRGSDGGTAGRWTLSRLWAYAWAAAAGLWRLLGIGGAGQLVGPRPHARPEVEFDDRLWGRRG